MSAYELSSEEACKMLGGGGGGVALGPILLPMLRASLIFFSQW